MSRARAGKKSPLSSGQNCGVSVRYPGGQVVHVNLLSPPPGGSRNPSSDTMRNKLKFAGAASPMKLKLQGKLSSPPPRANNPFRMRQDQHRGQVGKAQAHTQSSHQMNIFRMMVQTEEEKLFEDPGSSTSQQTKKSGRSWTSSVQV